MTFVPRFGVAAALVLVAGCNVLTGVDDVDLVRPTEEGEGGASAGLVSSAATGTTGGPSAGGGSAVTSASSGAGGGGCGVCGVNAHCEDATLTCVCNPGFWLEGGACVPAPVGSPEGRTASEVCEAWQEGHVVTTPSAHVTTGEDCDPGTLRSGAVVDTLARLNMFRWLVGLGPTSHDPGLEPAAQACANITAWWPFAGGSAHSPPPSSKCYTAEGAASAGRSNLAWGSGHPAQAVDQFMEDWGNETTMGHRRWLLNPPLGPIGIGYWQGGGLYGDGTCMEVFGMSGGSAPADWVAMPNPGFTPRVVASWTWTFHSALAGTTAGQVSVLHVEANMPLAVQMLPLQQGYGQPALSWLPEGWTPQAGQTYRVTVTGLTGGAVSYDVKPVDC